MAMNTLKFAPKKIEDGTIDVYAVITPNGKFLSIDIQSSNKEAGIGQQIRIPWEIIERETRK